MKVLVTGATGFIGSRLCQTLRDRSWEVHGTVRSTSSRNRLPSGVQPIEIDSLTQPFPPHRLHGIDAIAHLAARVHQMNDTAADPLAACRAINTHATLALARQAAQTGVRRFLYISSIKVNGEGQTTTDSPYTERDAPNPRDPYAQSKWEAERQLHQLSQDTGLEVTILRPPLVYGPGVKANFDKLVRLVRSGIPLPLASANNTRSLIYVGNLIDAIATCLSHPAAAGQTFLVSDGEDLSTAELIRRLALALNTRDRLFPVPPQLLQRLGQLTGKSATVDRLLGSLRIDSRKIRQTLDWTPPFSVTDGLNATAAYYKDGDSPSTATALNPR
jgi:nucleoside-diphosphate-sugar epimerase